MKPFAIACLVSGIVLIAVRADGAEEVPSFKKRGDIEKKFVASVGAAICKAARLLPQKMDLEDYKFTSPKPGRTHLNIQMAYHGVASKKKYTANITVIIDSNDKDNWEVLNIRFKDNNPSPLNPNEKKIQNLIKELNR